MPSGPGALWGLRFLRDLVNQFRLTLTDDSSGIGREQGSGVSEPHTAGEWTKEKNLLNASAMSWGLFSKLSESWKAEGHLDFLWSLTKHQKLHLLSGVENSPLIYFQYNVLVQLFTLFLTRLKSVQSELFPERFALMNSLRLRRMSFFQFRGNPWRYFILTALFTWNTIMDGCFKNVHETFPRCIRIVYIHECCPWCKM